MGIDFGDARVGIALSDPLGIMAQGYETLDNDGTDSLFYKIQSIIKEKEVTTIVIGLPKNMDNSEAVSYTHLDVYKRQVFGNFSVRPRKADGISAPGTHAVYRALVHLLAHRRKQGNFIESAFYKHFAKTCCEPEVSVNLEGGVGVEQVFIGGFDEHVFYILISRFPV